MRKFDPTKPVQTRDGRKARIIATDASDPHFPIVALLTQKAGGERPERYTFAGRYYFGDDILRPTDLVNVPPEKYVRWLNLYARPGLFTNHISREEADKHARPDRIACIRIEFEEGEGLS